MNTRRVEWTVKLIIVVGMLIYTGIGFNGYKDIDKRFFVISMGVDEGKEGMAYEVTLKLAMPPADPKMGKSEFLLVSHESNSIAEAVSVMKSQVDKELDYGQMKVILLGEAIAKKNVTDTMDWFFRRRDIQKVAYVAIAKPTAKEILAIKPKSERLPGNAFFLAFGDEGSETPYTITEYLFDFHRRLHERGIDAVVPLVEPFKEQFQIKKAYIVQKSGVALGLTPRDTATFSLLMNRAERATFTIEEQGYDFSITADEINFSYDLLPGDSPVATFNGKITGIVEVAASDVSYDELPEYAKVLKKSVEHQVVEVLEKFQKANVDPVGFGLRYRAISFRNEEEWERWQKMYPKLKFKADIKVNLETTGAIE
jgi:spore germination protein KC